MFDEAVSCLYYVSNLRTVSSWQVALPHWLERSIASIFNPLCDLVIVVAPMSSPHKSLPYSTTFWTVSFCLILVYVLSINTYPKCDSGLYGSPTYADCHDAFSSIPQDTAVRFFVEQQLRTAPPQADWTYFPDPRPLEYQQTLAQTPKWWSRGEP